MEFTNVTSDGQTWRYHEQGSGPVVIFTHGYPDTPESWSDAVNLAVSAGFRAVVPYLRGYHKDTLVTDRSYESEVLGQDILGLMDALEIEKAVLVGHDWGASACYSAAIAAPERVTGLVPIAIPHPASLTPSPGLLLQVRHFFALKMPWANAASKRSNFAYIDKLYRRWAPNWTDQTQKDAVRRVKEHFADDAVLDAANQYYRDLDLKPDTSGPKPAKISVPTMMVGGSEDFDRSAYDRSLKYFDGDAKVLMMEGAGHWPHREDPALFATEFSAFLGGLSG